MASPSNSKKGTNIIMRQGQTASEFGNDPNLETHYSEPTRDLKP